VSAHTDKEREEGHDAESDGELGQVPCASPAYAKQAVLLLAAVADAFGKVAALERRVDVLPIARPVWDFHHLALATFHEAIFDDKSVVQKLSPRVYEPVGASDSENIERQADGDEEKGDSVRCLPHRLSQD